MPILQSVVTPADSKINWHALRARSAGLPAYCALGALACAVLGRWLVVWQNYADLAHAWAVPALAAYLAWEHRLDCPQAAPSGRTSTPLRIVFATAALGTALLYLVGRALLYSFPTWPAALWLFSAAAWALALGLIALHFGTARARHFSFPILFTANALPWVTVMNTYLILPLRSGLAVVASEVVDFMGYPTSVAGTVITVGRGQVGVDEACSGVRSLQTALMLALFFGEMLRLRIGRRLALIGIGIGFALLSNLGRTCFLTWQAAAHGPEVSNGWHDAAGNWQMLFALGGLVWVASRWSSGGMGVPPTEAKMSTGVPPVNGVQASHRPAAWALLAWVLLLEIPILGWFSSGPTSATTQAWQARLPTAAARYTPQPFSPYIQEVLRYDSYQAGSWQTPTGARRAGYILEWDQERGQIARDAISMHKPEVCLPGAGSRFLRAREPVFFTLADGTRLPFRASEYADERGTFQIYYLAWNLTHDRSLVPLRDEEGAAWWAFRLREFAARRGPFSARVIAIAFHDEPDWETASLAFQGEIAAFFNHDVK